MSGDKHERVFNLDHKEEELSAVSRFSHNSVSVFSKVYMDNQSSALHLQFLRGILLPFPS